MLKNNKKDFFFCKYNDAKSNRKKYGWGKGYKEFFKKEKKDDDIKDRVLRDIRTLFESDEKDYYKPKRTGNGF